MLCCRFSHDDFRGWFFGFLSSYECGSKTSDALRRFAPAWVRAKCHERHASLRVVLLELSTSLRLLDLGPDRWLSSSLRGVRCFALRSHTDHSCPRQPESVRDSFWN